MITDIIISLVLVVLVGGAVTYIYRAKKRGDKCIGCPHARECSKKNCK